MVVPLTWQSQYGQFTDGQWIKDEWPLEWVCPGCTRKTSEPRVVEVRVKDLETP